MWPGIPASLEGRSGRQCREMFLQEKRSPLSGSPHLARTTSPAARGDRLPRRPTSLCVSSTHTGCWSCYVSWCLLEDARCSEILKEAHVREFWKTQCSGILEEAEGVRTACVHQMAVTETERHRQGLPGSRHLLLLVQEAGHLMRPLPGSWTVSSRCILAQRRD